jgi:NAD(P)H-flavin reductase
LTARPLFTAPRDFRAILRCTIELTPSTKHFEWEVLDDAPLNFLAGQFLSLKVWNNGYRVIRPYSIASAPRRDQHFDLCLNRVEGGYVSNYLSDLQAGSVVDFRGPYGSFIVSRPVTQNLVFLATGTGIAPIRGMLMDLFTRAVENLPEIWLLFGVRIPETILYRSEFERWATVIPGFHFVPILSRPPAEWRGAAGHVQDHLRLLFSGHKDFQAYICGLNGMVEEVRSILKCEFRLTRQQIRSERYD